MICVSVFNVFPSNVIFFNVFFLRLSNFSGVFLSCYRTPISLDIAWMARRLTATVAGSGASPGEGSVAEQ